MSATARNPPQRRSTRDDVVEAGVAITARGGLDELTVQSVADHLGIDRTSVYHHVPDGVAELRTVVVDRIVAIVRSESDPSPPHPTGLADLEIQLVILAEISGRFPGVIPYILTAGRDEPLALQGADSIVRVLLGSELAEVAPEAFFAINAYVTGWAHIQQHSPAAADAAGCQALADVMRASADLDRGTLLVRGFWWLLEGMHADAARANEASARPAADDPPRRGRSKP